MSGQLEKAKKVFANTKAAAILLTNTKQQSTNFLYLSGLTGMNLEGAFLIATKDKIVLLVSPLEYGDVLRQRPKGVEIIKIRDQKQVKLMLQKNFRNKTMGIDGSFLPYAYYNFFKEIAKPKKIIDVREAFSKARSIKEPDEIEKIRKAVGITKKTLKQLQKSFKTGMTERELAMQFEALAKKNGASGIAFDTIVCFGKNAALPHHNPDGTRLRANQFILIDCGARYKNYCADITRTYIFKPKVNSNEYIQMQEMYNIVKSAHDLALQKMTTDSKGSAPHLAALQLIDKAAGRKYKGKFIHALGHPLGLDTHDVGIRVGPKEDKKFEVNMVVTDEPGIYVEGFGGVRIEDDVLITERGPRVL